MGRVAQESGRTMRCIYVEVSVLLCVGCTAGASDQESTAGSEDQNSSAGCQQNEAAAGRSALMSAINGFTKTSLRQTKSTTDDDEETDAQPQTGATTS